MAETGVLYAVDPYPIGRLGFSMQRIIAEREVGRVKRGKISWIRLRGCEAANTVLQGGLVDFIFIDGDHSWEGISSDWRAWSAGLSPGGFIALHDSVSGGVADISDAGSVRFTREVVACDSRYELVDTVDTLTVWRRRLGCS